MGVWILLPLVHWVRLLKGQLTVELDKDEGHEYAIALAKEDEFPLLTTVL